MKKCTIHIIEKVALKPVKSHTLTGACLPPCFKDIACHILGLTGVFLFPPTLSKVCALLRFLHIGVVAGWQGRNEDFCLADLPRFGVGDRYRHSRIIHFHLFLSLVRQAHGVPLGLVPALVVLPELCVPISIRVFSSIFLPKQA